MHQGFVRGVADRIASGGWGGGGKRAENGGWEEGACGGEGVRFLDMRLLLRN